MENFNSYLKIIKKGSPYVLALTYIYDKIYFIYTISFKEEIYTVREDIKGPGTEPLLKEYKFKTKSILTLFFKSKEENLVEILLETPDDEITMYQK